MSCKDITVKGKDNCREAEMGTRQNRSLERAKLMKKSTEVSLSFPTGWWLKAVQLGQLL